MEYADTLLVLFGLVAGYAFSLVFPIRTKREISSIIDEIGKDIVLLEDVEKISEKVKEALRAHLDAHNMSIILYDDTDSSYKPVDQPEGPDLKEFYPFFYYLEMNDEVVSIDGMMHDTEAKKDVLESARRYFKEVKAKIAVPMIFERKLIGIINLDRKLEGKRYSKMDMEFLDRFRREITMSFTNSLLFIRMSKLFEEVEEQNSQLKRMDKIKSAFLEDSGHDLMNPISTLKNEIVTLDQESGGKYTERLNNAKTDVTKLEILANTLLVYARFESNKAVFHPEKTNMLEILEGVIDQVKPLLEKKQLQLETDMHEVVLPVDKDKIRLAVLNLIDNAIRFTEQGKIRVTMAAHDGKVSVHVIDTGIGIPKEKQERMFDKFNSNPGRNYGGMGIGLSVVRKIIELHKGEIHIESEVGKGTSIGFSLSY
jgi:signal transduction histidine kinase